MKSKFLILILILSTLTTSADWYHFYPHIRQVQMLSSNSGYAVGDHGLLLKYDGVNWSKINLGIEEDLWSLGFISNNDGYIGTFNGKLYHYNNGTLTLVFTTKPSYVQENSIFKIKMYSSNLGFFLNPTQIVKFDGKQWIVSYEASDEWGHGLKDIAYNTANDVWAVGVNRIVKRFNGSSWQDYSNSISYNSNLTCIFFNNGKGYTIGPYNCFYYDGYSWNAIPGGDGKEIWADSLNNIWTAGKNGIKHYNGSSWSSFTPVELNSIELNSLSFLNSNNGWIVGNRMTIVNLNNYVAQVVSKMPTQNNLWGVYFNSQNDGWAVGNSGTILHYNGVNWIPFSSPTSKNLNSVWFVAPNDGWCVGDGGCILHYNGNSWQLFSSPTQKKLYSIHFSNSSNGWVTGESVTLKYNGSNWVVNNDALGGQVIYTCDSNYTWLGSRMQAGSYSLGTLYKYTSGTWLTNSLPSFTSTMNLFGIYFIDPSHGFVVGYDTNSRSSINSNIWEFTSSTGWKLSYGLGPNDLNAIHCIDHNNCWTVGQEVIYKWDGTSWNTQRCIDAYLMWLYSVFMINSNKGWIVGSNGGIYYTENGGNPIITSSIYSKYPFNQDRLVIYPNPAKNLIYINILQNFEKAKTSIYSVDGHFIMETQENQIDVQNLKPGIYLVRTIIGSSSNVGKFVKQ